MTTFLLAETHVHLSSDGATDLLDSATLWTRSPAELDDALPGWLLGGFPIEATDEPGDAEMHPNGDELLCAAAGAIDVYLDGADGERVVRLETGQTCLVPAGTWHRLHGRRAGTLVTVTYGRGTRHR